MMGVLVGSIASETLCRPDFPAHHLHPIAPGCECTNPCRYHSEWLLRCAKPALRSEQLRERLAAGYAGVRHSGVQLARNVLDDMGIAAPDNLPAIASMLIAVCDGLMLRWIADPDATPNGAETLEALTSLAAIAALGTPAT